MAIGVIFNFPGGTTAQYDEVTRGLNNGQPLMPLIHQAGLKPDEPVVAPCTISSASRRGNHDDTA
jgi:hypothetical protein